jgi:hypothetical protein
MGVSSPVQIRFVTADKRVIQKNQEIGQINCSKRSVSALAIDALIETAVNEPIDSDYLSEQPVLRQLARI